MATGGGDIDRSEQIMRDIEMANDETFEYNVDVQNRYVSKSGWGNGGYELVDRGSKRKRISTGSTSSMSAEYFHNLDTDKKLSVLFELMCNVQTMQNRSAAELKTITGIFEKADNIEKRVDIHDKKLRMLSYKSVDIEALSRRNNLIFWGITENNSRQCETLILSFLADEMRIDTAGIVIDRAHRLGPVKRTHVMNRSDPKRPIIVRFRDYRDIDHILDNAYRLKGSRFRVDRDYPKEIAEARTRLYQSTEVQEARKRRSKIQVKYPARLYINDRLVRDEFPDWFDLMRESRIESFDGVENYANVSNISGRSSTNQYIKQKVDSSINISTGNRFRDTADLTTPDPDNFSNNNEDNGQMIYEIGCIQTERCCEHDNLVAEANGPINISSKSLSFSVESMLLSDSKLQSQNNKQTLATDSQQRQEANDLITLDIQEDSSQTNTKYNHDISPDKESVKSDKFSPVLQSEQETETCVNPILTQTKHNPPQNNSIDKNTYTMNKPESHKVCRPKSMIRENTRASSVDTWLSSDMEAVIRRSRSRVRKSIHEAGDSKSREYRRGRSPASPGVPRPTVLAPPKFTVGQTESRNRAPVNEGKDSTNRTCSGQQAERSENTNITKNQTNQTAQGQIDNSKSGRNVDNGVADRVSEVQ